VGKYHTIKKVTWASLLKTMVLSWCLPRVEKIHANVARDAIVFTHINL